MLRRLLGLAGHQTSSRFRERPCLRGIRQRVTDQDSSVFLWAAQCAYRLTPRIKAKSRKGWDIALLVKALPTGLYGLENDL